ncbi:MAG: hypothetical protein GY715_16975 [Planctomycetes bacterium]|nr:hypothetical protein [Planctomycetota bacterium]
MIRTLLLSVALPAFVALVALLTGWRPWRRDGTLARGAWSGAVAFGGAFLVAFVAEVGTLEFPPAERWQWIAPLVALAVAVGLALALLVEALPERAAPWLRLVAAIVLGVGAGWMLNLPRLDGVGARVGLGAAIAVAVVVLDLVATRHQGVLIPLVMAACLTAVSVIVLQSNNMIATIAGACGAATGSATLVALLRRDVSLAAGAAPVLATILVAVAACGYAYDYADIPLATFALPTAALLACLACDARPFAPLRGLTGAMLRLVLVTLICGGAVVWALAIASGGDGPSDYGY